jgi:hypothetical protein
VEQPSLATEIDHHAIGGCGVLDFLCERVEGSREQESKAFSKFAGKMGPMASLKEG